LRVLEMRLKDKVAIVVGAGQTPGDTIGNGRATAILFAREGARVVLVDRDKQSALETQALIEAKAERAFQSPQISLVRRIARSLCELPLKLTTEWISCITTSGSAEATMRF